MKYASFGTLTRNCTFYYTDVIYSRLLGRYDAATLFIILMCEIGAFWDGMVQLHFLLYLCMKFASFGTLKRNYTFIILM